MANEFKITDVVDPKAAQQLKELTKEFDATATSYASLARTIASGIKLNPTTLQGLSDKTELYNKNLTDLINTQNKLSDLQEKQLGVLSRIEKSIATYTSTVTQAGAAIAKEMQSINANTQAVDKSTKATEILTRAKKIGAEIDKEVAELISVTLGTRSENLKALAREQQQLSILSKEKKSIVGVSASLVQREIEIKNAMAETNAILNNQQKIMNAAPGSYEDMTLSLARMELAYNKLNKADRDSSAGQGLLGSIGELSGRVKEYQTSLKKIGEANIDLSPINKLLQEQDNIYASLNANLGERQHRVLSEARAAQEAALSIGQKDKAEISYLATVGDVTNLVNNSLKTTERRIIALNEEKRQLVDVKAQLLMVSKAQNENLISTEAAAKAKAVLVLQENQHKIAISNIEQSLNNEQKLLLSAANSGKESALMLERMKIAYHSLSEEVKGMPVGKQLLSDIQSLDKQVKTSDASIGNHQRNVGNYKMAFDGLGMSVQQVARELPSLAIGWNTFFLAISNNLPILADELKKAKSEFKAMQAAGQEGVPVWKRMTGAIFNWQTALVIGITLLSVYGKDIMNWVGKLFKAENAVNDLLSAEQEMTLARKESIKNSIKEQVELDIIYKKLKNTTTSAKEKVAAYNELIKKGPQYSNVLKGEIVDITRLDASYKSLKEQIVASALAKAQSERIEKTASKRYNAWIKERNSYVTYLKSNEELEKNNSNLQKDVTNNAKKQWESAKKELKGYNDILDEMINGINAENLFPQPEAGTKAYFENMRTQAVKAIESIKPEFLKLLKLGNTEGIDDSIVETYKSAIKKRNEADKNLSIYDDVNKSHKQLEKEAESHAKYMIRIENSLAEARASVIDQQRQSEVEGVKAEYQKKLSIIKDGSDKEKELKELYAKAQAKEISEINDRYDREKDTGNIEARLSVLREDNDKELEERLGLLLKQNEILREAEVHEAEKTEKDVGLVHEKYDASFIRLIKDNAEKRASLIGKTAKIGNTDLENAIEMELNSARLSYQLGLKDREAYEKEKIAISMKYLKKQLELQIDAAEKMLSVDGLSAEKKKEYEQEIAALRNKLAAAGMDATDAAANGALATTKKWWDDMDWKGKTEFIVESFADMFGQVNELMSNIYDGKIQKIEEEQELNQEAGDAEIERIERLADTGAITSEEAEARKRTAADNTAKKDKELAKKKADLQTKQAKMEKSNAIVQTIIATALAIIKAMPNIPLSIIAGITGAASLATIIAQPIPKYAKGTDNHPGGLAVVGDGGKQEMILSSGKSWITPSIPTLVDIPKGSVVLPDVMDMESIRNMRSDLVMLVNESARNGNPININVNNDYKKLESKLDTLNSSFNKMAKYQRKAAIEADLRNIASRL